MFSQTFEYALRCLLFLARSGDATCPIPHIAEQTEIPRDYLYKLVSVLAAPGLVAVRRGKQGGLRLRRTPGAISAFDILRAVEPWRRMDGCPLSNRSRCARTGIKGNKLCGLHTALDQIADAVERRLKSITLADFLREGSVSLVLPDSPPKGRMARSAKAR